jgi:hypothetical protein
MAHKDAQDFSMGVIAGIVSCFIATVLSLVLYIYMQNLELEQSIKAEASQHQNVGDNQ